MPILRPLHVVARIAFQAGQMLSLSHGESRAVRHCCIHPNAIARDGGKSFVALYDIDRGEKITADFRSVQGSMKLCPYCHSVPNKTKTCMNR